MLYLNDVYGIIIKADSAKALLEWELNFGSFLTPFQNQVLSRGMKVKLGLEFHRPRLW